MSATTSAKPQRSLSEIVTTAAKRSLGVLTLSSLRVSWLLLLFVRACVRAFLPVQRAACLAPWPWESKVSSLRATSVRPTLAQAPTAGRVVASVAHSNGWRDGRPTRRTAAWLPPVVPHARVVDFATCCVCLEPRERVLGGVRASGARHTNSVAAGSARRGCPRTTPPHAQCRALGCHFPVFLRHCCTAARAGVIPVIRGVLYGGRASCYGLHALPWREVCGGVSSGCHPCHCCSDDADVDADDDELPGA
jgi:hypothetical protein